MARTIRRFVIRYCDQLQLFGFWLYVVAASLMGVGTGAWLMMESASKQVVTARIDSADKIDAANQRAAEYQASNAELLAIIGGRLAATTTRVAETAQAVDGMARTASEAATTASVAASKASTAASKASEAVAKASIRETVIVEIPQPNNPPLPGQQAAPGWMLNGG